MLIDSYSTANGGDTSGVGAGTAFAQPAAQMAPPNLVGEVMMKFSAWRSLRRSVEIQWYISAATVRGLVNVRWNDLMQKLENDPRPSYKASGASNMVLPKYRARKAKFLKNKYQPIVVPSSTDREDKLNATASQKGLEYLSRKIKLEQVYKDAVDYALVCGKGFIWLYWDKSLVRKVKDPLTQQVTEAAVGDITASAGSPFEVLVPDIGISRIGDQPEFMRVRLEPIEEFKLRHQDVPDVQDLVADHSKGDLFQYQKQIATLASNASNGLLGVGSGSSTKELDQVTVIEFFKRPCVQYPQGMYALIAGDKVIKYSPLLPYGFAGDTNPYPVVEFCDLDFAGQFWPTTIVEQLIAPQREYHYIRAKLRNHIAKQVHPKILVSAHSKFPENAWTDEAGEVIRILTPPGIMEPQVIVPPPISQDVWNTLGLIKEEMDTIPTLYRASEGQSGGATSGFQVNLLQEATDSVHAPDIRSHELEYEELYKKMRKMMALGYTVPRLISAIGRNYIPDVIELSTNNIDQDAEIIVMTASALSNSPAIRTQQVIELWKSVILTDDNNPSEGKRKALTLLDTNGLGEFQEEKRRDEEKARLENLSLMRGQPVEPPLPFDDHVVQYMIHVDETKSPGFALWPEPQKQQLYIHIVQHMKYFNPQQALNTLNELGLGQLGPQLLPQMFQPQQQQAPPAGGQPANAGASAPMGAQS